MTDSSSPISDAVTEGSPSSDPAVPAGEEVAPLDPAAEPLWSLEELEALTPPEFDPRYSPPPGLDPVSGAPSERPLPVEVSPVGQPAVEDRGRPTELPSDGVVPVVLPVFGPVRALPEKASEVALDRTEAVLDGLPIAVQPASVAAARGGRVAVRPLPAATAATLSEVGWAFELEFTGFGGLPAGVGAAGPDTLPEGAVGASFDVGFETGWKLVIDPASLSGSISADMLSRLVVSVVSDCGPDGTCLVRENLPTRRDAQGRLIAELTSNVLATSGGPRSAPADVFWAPDAGPGRVAAGLLSPGTVAYSTTPLSVYYVVSTGPASNTGSYAATPLGSLSTWQVGLQTGHAEAGYSLPLPPAPGPAPQVTFSYSSGSVDGMHVSSNNQPSQIGLGWSQSVPVISRATRSCGSNDAGGSYTENLCFAASGAGGKDEGFTLSMNGVGGRLVKTSTAAASHPQWTGATYETYAVETLNDWRIWKVQLASGVGTDWDVWGTWWEITTGDGTLYVFGKNEVIKPANSAAAIPLAEPRSVHAGTLLNSVSFAPVYIQGAGGVGAQAAIDGGCVGHELCDVALSWYLDQVIDTSGNQAVMRYFAEPNNYLAKVGGATMMRVYTKAVSPNVWTYNRRFGDPYAEAAPYRAVFDYAWRNPQNSPSPTSWPDTPTDMNCGPTACTKKSPSFHSGLRMLMVTTYGGGQAAERIQFDNAHWPVGAGALDLPKLENRGIQLIGLTGPAATMPSVTYTYELKPNRTNGAMNMGRLKTITNELGGVVTFTYGQPYPPSSVNGSVCSTTSALPANGYIRLPCNMYPAFDAYTSPAGFVTWNKWVVTSERRDPVKGQSPQYEEFTYTYQTVPDWAYRGTWGHTETDGAQCKIGYGCNHWNDYRGHRRVKVTDRSGAATEHFFYTGMAEDRCYDNNVAPLNSPSCPHSNPSETVLDAQLVSLANSRPLAGRSLGSRVLTSGGVQRFAEPRTYGFVQAFAAYPVSNRITSEQSRPHWYESGTFASAASVTTYFDAYSRPSRTEDLGNTWGVGATAADDRTTYYWYGAAPTPTGPWVIARPYQVGTKPGTGASTDAGSGFVSVSAFYFDSNPTFGAAPSKGLATSELGQLRQNASGVAQFHTTTRSYNNRGLVESESSAAAGTTTSFGYDANGLVSSVDGPLTAADVTTYVNDARFGVPTTTVAPNAQTTTVALDALGRVSTVTLPGAASPSMAHDYIAAGAGTPAQIRSTTHRGGGSLVWSWEMFDGFGRSIQSQSYNENGSSLNVVSSNYDTAGRPWWTTEPYTISGTPGVFHGYSTSSIPNTTTDYDTDGLVWTRAWGLAGLESSTTTRTSGLRTTTVDANGNQTVSLTDTRGQVLTVTEPGGAVSSYVHNVRGDVTAITDPAGNTISTVFGLWESQPTQLVDPDLGTVTYSYDGAGRLSRQTDARGNRIGVNYSQGRVSGLVWCNASTATTCVPSTVLSSYTYDSLKVGLLSSSTHTNLRQNGSSAGTVAKSYSYDARLRMTQTAWTIPGLPGGTQDIDYTYREMGGVDTVAFPDGTVVDFGFNALERPNSVTAGAATVVDRVTRNARGQVLELWRGDPGWATTNRAALMSTYSYQDVSGRVASARTQGLGVADGLRDQLTRLYRSAFNRDPDDPGYTFWLGQMGGGVAFGTIATVFAASGEFPVSWTDPWNGAVQNVTTNAGFVQWAYGHILNRAPGTRGGDDWWLAQLNAGSWTRGQVLAYFSDTAEAQANPGVGKGDATSAPVTPSAETADIVMRYNYVWDAAGNLTRTHETSEGTDEWQCFAYDNRHRLSAGNSATPSGCTGPVGGGAFPFSVVYGYDSVGNITSASGTHTVSGSYGYGVGLAGPHAVTSAGPHTYTYDASGNQTVRSLNGGSFVQNLVYDVSNRLVNITGAGPDLDALYDADGDRVKRTLNGGVTYYLGESYELEVGPVVAEDGVGLWNPSSFVFTGANSLSATVTDVTSSPWGATGDLPVAGDWNGDGTDEPGVFRPSAGVFFFKDSFTGSGSFQAVYGASVDLPVVGDWDGDGVDTMGVWRTSDYMFYLKNANTAGLGDVAVGPYGAPGDVPIAGDWDGDGDDEVGVFRPSTSTFFLRQFGGHFTSFVLGASGDVPVAGDWDGDGVDTVGVWRPSVQRFYLTSTHTSTVAVTTAVWGASTQKPVVGNWDGSIATSGTQATIDVALAGHLVGSVVGGRFWAAASDHLGSGSVLRDAEAHTRRQRYTPFGAVRAPNLENGLPVDEGFTGQTADAGLGLIDYNARHYDPQLGRFIMADTILDGLNRYTYVGNNPLNTTDPSGHCPANSNCAAWAAVEFAVPQNFSPPSCVPMPSNPCSGANPGRSSSGIAAHAQAAVDNFDTSPCDSLCELIALGGLAALGVDTLFDGVDCLGGSSIACVAVFVPGASGAVLRNGSNAIGLTDEAVGFAPRLLPNQVADSVEFGSIRFSDTAASHATSRPYVDSPLTLEEIVRAADPIPDPGGLPSGWRWDVPGSRTRSGSYTDGSRNTTQGTWEVVIDLDTNTVVHFLFRPGS